jgi:hypothetical protein
MLVSPSPAIGILPRKTQCRKIGVYYICFNKPKILGCSAGLGKKAFYGNRLGFLAFAVLA